MTTPMIPTAERKIENCPLGRLATLYPYAFAMAAAANSSSGLALRRLQLAQFKPVANRAEQWQPMRPNPADQK